MTRDDLLKAKVAELREVLAAHGAPTDGSKDDLRARAERVMFLNDATIPEAPVVGGAKVEIVEIVPAMPDAPDGIAVVAIRRGAGPGGLVEPGTAFTVAPAMYSPNWMRPADEAAAKALEAWRSA